MFHDNSAQREIPAGITGDNVPNPVVSVLDASNAEGNPNQSESGSGGLPWYLADKFEWRRNKSGRGQHLAPQQVYTSAVIDEAKILVNKAATELFGEDSNSEEKDMAAAFYADLKSLIETQNSFDTSGTEANLLVRMIRDRVVLAHKIAGASQVSRMQRLYHARQQGQDTNEVTENEYFIRDGEVRDKWTRSAVYYIYVWTQLRDDGLTTDVDLDLDKSIGSLLYSDAIDAGRRLQNPSQRENALTSQQVDMSDLRALAT